MPVPPLLSQMVYFNGKMNLIPADILTESVITGQDWISNHVSLLTVSQTGNLSTKIYDRSALNKLYTDIGLVGPVMQCDENDGTCAQMEKQVPWKEPLGTWATERGSLKYVLDLGE